MTDPTTTAPNTRLRRDLSSVIYRGRNRDQRVVIDEVSGNFTRTAEHVWQSLLAGTSDERIWRQADAAGWTRSRHAQDRATKQTAFAFRIPLGTIDPLARRLAGWSGVLFSRTAVVCWVGVILFAIALCLNHSGELAIALGKLPSFLSASGAFSIAAVFIATKFAHELAHGVACRRVGGRVGDVGVMLLCGIPCPYCDVTDVWRQPSAVRRAAVMLAGIYVELIVASLAFFVWLGATDPTVRFHMLNLMVVCSVSTIVFNANPLMRYDGYFVLADYLGSVNLRREAHSAFSAVVMARIAGPNYGLSKSASLRDLALTCYHALATLYKVLVLVSIATLILGFAGGFHLRSMAAILVLSAAAIGSFRGIRRLVGITRGGGNWEKVPSYRRFCFVLVFIFVVLCAAFFPTPRYRRVSGWIDSSDAMMVYMRNAGIVADVTADYGESVRTGDRLVEIDNDRLELQAAKLRGQLAVATIRRDQSRRGSLAVAARDRDLQALEVAREALHTQLVSVRARIQQTEIQSPASGIVIPASSKRRSSDVLHLKDRLGSATEAHESWCRVAPNKRLHAVLELNARDRRLVELGTRVRICPNDHSGTTFFAHVDSISQLSEEKESITQEAKFKVLCPIEVLPTDDLISWLGRDCETIVELPKRSLASDAYQWTLSWLGGE